MSITIFEEEDALYIRLLDVDIESGRRLDDRRHTDLSADGRVVAIEFLSKSKGVDVEGIPGLDEITKERVASMLARYNVRVLVA